MIGVVTGLTAEARIAAPLGQALAGGGLPAGAGRAAARLADGGATALISFGLAGGLAGGLTPGAIVIPRIVATATARFTTDARLNAWLGGVTAEALFAAEAVAASAAAKQALRQDTGADAIDLESGAVAALAQTRGLPFAVLRAICDPAEADLPPAALVALEAGGEIGFGRVLGAVLRHPGQIPALLRLGGQAATARKALLRHVAALKPRGAFGA